MIEKRKQDHLRICIEENVESGCTGFSQFRLTHEALPEIDFDSISLETEFLGRKFAYPLIIEAITGGIKSAQTINRELAKIAEMLGIGFGVGSQRKAIENNELACTYQVKDTSPEVFLIANLGAVQLNYGYGIPECERAIDMIDADAIALHINPLQEAVQPEGDRNFSALTEKINRVAEKISTPVIAKCVGCGISKKTAEKLNVAAVDVGGSGGTSWSLIEGLRGDAQTQKLGEAFAGWGIPTAESIIEVSSLGVPTVGSGGIRNGIDAVKAIALGASCVGIALPVLRAWKDAGPAGVEEYLNGFLKEMQTAMFLTGSASIREIKGKITKQK